MKALAVSAQQANGKDVLCDHLVGLLNRKFSEHDPSKWHRTAFANAVKEVFETSFGVNREFTETWKRNSEAPPDFLKNIRKSLQFIGDGFRQIKDDIWIDIALRDEQKKLIISDGRYINEAKAVKAKGGITVVLYRPGFLNDDPNPSESQIRPIVEFCDQNLEEGPIPNFSILTEEFGDIVPTAMQYYDFYLVNDGTLENLYEKIDSMLVPYIEQRYSRIHE